MTTRRPQWAALDIADGSIVTVDPVAGRVAVS